MKLFWVLIFIAIVGSCSNKRYVGVAKIKNYYASEVGGPPEYKLYAVVDSTSLYFKTPIIDDNSRKPYNEIKQRLQVAVFSDFTKKILIDSIGFNVVANFNNNERKKMIEGKVNLGSLLPNKRPLVVEISSGRKDIDFPVKLLFLDSLGYDQSNFLVSDKSDKVYLENYITTDQDTYLQSELFNKADLLMETYLIKEDLPKTPFSNYIPAPDKQMPIKRDTLKHEDGKYVFRCPINSFVDITSLENPEINTTVFHFDMQYPEVKEVDVLVDALRYITTEEEYDVIRNSDDPKAAIDSFWLSCSGSKERARKLIKSYYGRVEYSNRYFTAHVPGWKSDRGLIYVIFGPPKSVFLSGNREIWDYGEQGSRNNISFEFVKTKNPFSETDFRLRRNEIYKPNWYRVVSAWREGRIFYD